MVDYRETQYAGIYVFEGIDNVGKSTIIQKLKEKMDESKKLDCVNMAFPGNEPRSLGNLVYDIHHHQEKYFDCSLSEISLQLLHVASHIDLIQRRLLKMNNSQNIVLLDRFWWSTYVYGLAGELEKDTIRAIIAPELKYWKQLNIKKIFLIERENRERDYGIEKDKRIVNIYRELANEESNCVILNNDGSIEKVVNKIYNNIFGE